MPDDPTHDESAKESGCLLRGCLGPLIGAAVLTVAMYLWITIDYHIHPGDYTEAGRMFDTDAPNTALAAAMLFTMFTAPLGAVIGFLARIIHE